MKSKVNRTRSSWSTNNLSKKLSLYEDDIQEISRNTIIPFVNSRFSMVSANYSTLTGQKKPISSSNGLKLACLVIFNKVQKINRTLACSMLLELLKANTFQKKMIFFFKSKSDQVKRDAFKALAKECFIKMASQKLFLFDFINKKIVNFQLSYGFRKIIMYSYLKKQRCIESSQQNSIINQSQSRLSNSQKTIKQRNSYNESREKIYSANLSRQTPSRLKPDKIDSHRNKQYVIWRVDSSFDKFSS